MSPTILDNRNAGSKINSKNTKNLTENKAFDPKAMYEVTAGLFNGSFAGAIVTRNADGSLNLDSSIVKQMKSVFGEGHSDGMNLAANSTYLVTRLADGTKIDLNPHSHIVKLLEITNEATKGGLNSRNSAKIRIKNYLSKLNPVLKNELTKRMVGRSAETVGNMDGKDNDQITLDLITDTCVAIVQEVSKQHQQDLELTGDAGADKSFSKTSGNINKVIQDEQGQRTLEADSSRTKGWIAGFRTVFNRILPTAQYVIGGAPLMIWGQFQEMMTALNQADQSVSGLMVRMSNTLKLAQKNNMSQEDTAKLILAQGQALSELFVNKTDEAKNRGKGGKVLDALSRTISTNTFQGGGLHAVDQIQQNQISVDYQQLYAFVGMIRTFKTQLKSSIEASGGKLNQGEQALMDNFDLLDDNLSKQADTIKPDQADQRAEVINRLVEKDDSKFKKALGTVGGWFGKGAEFIGKGVGFVTDKAKQIASPITSRIDQTMRNSGNSVVSSVYEYLNSDIYSQRNSALELGLSILSNKNYLSAFADDLKSQNHGTNSLVNNILANISSPNAVIGTIKKLSKSNPEILINSAVKVLPPEEIARIFDLVSIRTGMNTVDRLKSVGLSLGIAKLQNVGLASLLKSELAVRGGQSYIELLSAEDDILSRTADQSVIQSNIARWGAQGGDFGQTWESALNSELGINDIAGSVEKFTGFNITGKVENRGEIVVNGKTTKIEINSLHTRNTGLNFNGLNVKGLSAEQLAKPEVKSQILELMRSQATVVNDSKANIINHPRSGVQLITGLQARQDGTIKSANAFVFNVGGREIGAGNSGETFMLNGQLVTVLGSSVEANGEAALVVIPVAKALTSPSGVIDTSKVQYVQYSKEASKEGAVGTVEPPVTFTEQTPQPEIITQSTPEVAQTIVPIEPSTTINLGTESTFNPSNTSIVTPEKLQVDPAQVTNAQAAVPVVAKTESVESNVVVPNPSILQPKVDPTKLGGDVSFTAPNSAKDLTQPQNASTTRSMFVEPSVIKPTVKASAIEPQPVTPNSTLVSPLTQVDRGATTSENAVTTRDLGALPVVGDNSVRAVLANYKGENGKSLFRTDGTTAVIATQKVDLIVNGNKITIPEGGKLLGQDLLLAGGLGTLPTGKLREATLNVQVVTGGAKLAETSTVKPTTAQPTFKPAAVFNPNDPNAQIGFGARVPNGLLNPTISLEQSQQLRGATDALEKKAEARLTQLKEAEARIEKLREPVTDIKGMDPMPLSEAIKRANAIRVELAELNSQIKSNNDQLKAANVASGLFGVPNLKIDPNRAIFTPAPSLSADEIRGARDAFEAQQKVIDEKLAKLDPKDPKNTAERAKLDQQKKDIQAKIKTATGQIESLSKVGAVVPVEQPKPVLSKEQLTTLKTQFDTVNQQLELLKKDPAANAAKIAELNAQLTQLNSVLNLETSQPIRVIDVGTSQRIAFSISNIDEQIKRLDPVNDKEKLVELNAKKLELTVFLAQSKVESARANISPFGFNIPEAKNNALLTLDIKSGKFGATLDNPTDALGQLSGEMQKLNNESAPKMKELASYAANGKPLPDSLKGIKLPKGLTSDALYAQLVQNPKAAKDMANGTIALVAISDVQITDTRENSGFVIPLPALIFASFEGKQTLTMLVVTENSLLFNNQQFGFTDTQTGKPISSVDLQPKIEKTGGKIRITIPGIRVEGDLSSENKFTLNINGQDITIKDPETIEKVRNGTVTTNDILNQVRLTDPKNPILAGAVDLSKAADAKSMKIEIDVNGQKKSVDLLDVVARNSNLFYRTIRGDGTNINNQNVGREVLDQENLGLFLFLVSPNSTLTQEEKAALWKEAKAASSKVYGVNDLAVKGGIDQNARYFRGVALGLDKLDPNILKRDTIYPTDVANLMSKVQLDSVKPAIDAAQSVLKSSLNERLSEYNRFIPAQLWLEFNKAAGSQEIALSINKILDHIQNDRSISSILPRNKVTELVSILKNGDYQTRLAEINALEKMLKQNIQTSESTSVGGLGVGPKGFTSFSEDKYTYSSNVRSADVTAKIQDALLSNPTMITKESVSFIGLIPLPDTYLDPLLSKLSVIAALNVVPVMAAGGVQKTTIYGSGTFSPEQLASHQFTPEEQKQMAQMTGLTLKVLTDEQLNEAALKKVQINGAGLAPDLAMAQAFIEQSKLTESSGKYWIEFRGVKYPFDSLEARDNQIKMIREGKNEFAETIIEGDLLSSVGRTGSHVDLFRNPTMATMAAYKGVIPANVLDQAISNSTNELQKNYYLSLKQGSSNLTSPDKTFAGMPLDGQIYNNEAFEKKFGFPIVGRGRFGDARGGLTDELFAATDKRVNIKVVGEDAKYVYAYIDSYITPEGKVKLCINKLEIPKPPQETVKYGQSVVFNPTPDINWTGATVKKTVIQWNAALGIKPPQPSSTPPKNDTPDTPTPKFNMPPKGTTPVRPGVISNPPAPNPLNPLAPPTTPPLNPLTPPAVPVNPPPVSFANPTISSATGGSTPTIFAPATTAPANLGSSVVFNQAQAATQAAVAPINAIAAPALTNVAAPLTTAATTATNVVSTVPAAFAPTLPSGIGAVVNAPGISSLVTGGSTAASTGAAVGGFLP